jgi:hypothetical protein
VVKVVGNADKQETGRWLNNRAENFKPMWQLLGSGYTGLPDERFDASRLGCQNAKKKVSNPLPGVARRERPLADVQSNTETCSLASPAETFVHSGAKHTNKLSQGVQPISCPVMRVFVNTRISAVCWIRGQIRPIRSTVDTINSLWDCLHCKLKPSSIIGYQVRPISFNAKPLLAQR